MEKKMKYNFELKLEFLKFFHFLRVMPPLQHFPKNGNYGGHDPHFYGINFI